MHNETGIKIANAQIFVTKMSYNLGIVCQVIVLNNGKLLGV
jgi:hypothetical protein